MKNIYSGTIEITPPLNENEFKTINNFLNIIKNHIQKNTSIENFSNELNKFLNVPINKNTGIAFFYSYSDSIVLHKDKIELLNLTQKHPLKKTIEILNFLFFDYKLIPKLIEDESFKEHKLNGTIYGTNSDNDKWIYLIENNKIYNLEGNDKIYKPKFDTNVFSEYFEIAKLRSEIKTTKKRKTKNKI